MYRYKLDEFEGVRGDVHIPPFFFVYYSKKRKKYKSMTIIHHFDSIFFSRINNKKIYEKGPKGAPLLFLYELSIVVLIDFIAILLTPGIFLIQIVDRNMYLIHFYI